MRLAIDHKSPVPLHAQVEELVRTMIKDPELKMEVFYPMK